MLKSLNYDKLQRRLAKKAEKKNFPFKALFELTYRCNLKCRHCYLAPPDNGSRQKELNTQQLFIILEQLAAAECLNLGFTGGEPFLREDIFDILEYAKRLGFNIIVLTNGTLLTPKKADRLQEIGVNKIDISFHSSNRETFDRFAQAPGTYRKALRAVQLLRDRDIEVYLKTTAMTINKDEMVRLSPIVTPRRDGKKDNLRFRLSAQEIIHIEKNMQNDTEIELEKLDALERTKRRPKGRKWGAGKISHNRLFRCGAGRTEVTINPYGEMKLCPDIPEPKYPILKGSFAEGWKMLNDYAENTSPGPSYQCRDCELIQYCEFCPAMGWLECADASACPPYYRARAQAAKLAAEKSSREIRR
jgi:radical SAM protein with 4Fe4S-binding SPASM domain